MTFHLESPRSSSPFRARPSRKSALRAGFRWVTLITLWGLAVVLWLPKAVPTADSSTLTRCLAICVHCCASGFLLYSSYHLTALAFAVWRTRRPSSASYRARPPIPVGILMTVSDDFAEAAARTMLDQRYDSLHLYLCDDSSQSSVRERIDAFQIANSGRVTVLRRGGRSGFKAGNLNHALRSGLVKEPLLLLVDADERLEPEAVCSMVEEFLAERPVFLQASHRADEENMTPFQWALAPSVSVYWLVYEQARNDDGFPLFLGHGVLLRRSLLDRLGGFDETTTSEDIEFSYRLALAQARRGHVSRRCWATEEIPPSYPRYRRRFCRWLRQDVLFAVRAIPIIFSRRNSLSVTERLDLLLKQLHIPMCGLALPYLLLVAVLLVALRGEADAAHSCVSPMQRAMLLIGGAAFSTSAAMPVLLLAKGGLLRRLCAATASMWLFAALVPAAGAALITALARPTRRTFVPTGSHPPNEQGRTGPTQAVVELLVVGLGMFAECAVLPAIACAAFGARTSPGILRHLLHMITVALLVATVAQLHFHPEYLCLLIPLGAFRY